MSRAEDEETVPTKDLILYRDGSMMALFVDDFLDTGEASGKGFVPA